MTLSDLINLYQDNLYIWLSFYILIPILIFLLSKWQKNTYRNIENINKILTFLLYVIVISWIFVFILILYKVFALKISILELDILTYFSPILSMIASIFIIKSSVWFSNIWWMKKIYWILSLVFSVSLILFFIDRLHFIVLFNSSILQLFLFFLILFFVIKYSWNLITKK